MIALLAAFLAAGTEEQPITQQAWFPGFVTGLLALFSVLIASYFQNRREQRREREGRKEAVKTPEPPTTQQVWERLDRVERTLGSAVFILGEVAEQWDSSHPPVLSKKHVKVLSEAGYLPPEWEPEVTENE